MTYEFAYLMSILSYTAVGGKLKPPKQAVDWARLYKLAEEQTVRPLVAYALGYSNACFIPDNVKIEMRNRARSMTIHAFARKQAVLEITGQLETQGIRIAILKGFSTCDFYKIPYARISGDTDILIDQQDEGYVLHFFKNRKFKIIKRETVAHHSTCYSGATGTIEIHTSLYDKRASDIWFGDRYSDEKVKEPYKSVQDPEGRYYTLGDTDNIIFLTLHMIKHFIPGSTNLRQIMDVTLCYVSSHEKINTERYWNLLDRLGYKILIVAVMSLTIKYCALPKEWLDLLPQKVSKEIELMIIDDTEKGCKRFQNTNGQRSRSGNIYSRIRGENKMGKAVYGLYLLKRKADMSLKYIFPPMIVLSGKYPCLRRTVLLLPFVWFYHIFVHGTVFFVKKARRHVNVKNALPEHGISEQRILMFQKLNMISH